MVGPGTSKSRSEGLDDVFETCGFFRFPTLCQSESPNGGS